MKVAIPLFFLPCLATYPHILFNLLLPLSAPLSFMCVLWSLLPLTPPISSLSPPQIPFPKHLHVSVTFSLKILLSIFCSSRITSPQDKNSTIKPLLTESGGSNIRFFFSSPCQLSNLSWHWLGVGQIWWLLRVPPSYPVDVKSGRLDSLSATWPTHALCSFFGLWALGSIFISVRSLTLHWMLLEMVLSSGVA